MPARFKDFFEQGFRPGFALHSGERFPRKLLQERSARIVVAMSMPMPVDHWYFGVRSLKSLERNAL